MRFHLCSAAVAFAASKYVALGFTVPSFSRVPTFTRGGYVKNGLHMSAVSTSPSESINNVFAKAKEDGIAALVGYMTAGYPDRDGTVPRLLAMQDGGTDIIELGVPFTDPQADGTTIQRANEVALENHVSLEDCLNYVKEAREKELTVPVILMGYYNPLLAYGLDKLMKDAVAYGVNGFIIVDLPPEQEEGKVFIETCKRNGLSYVPLVSPTTTNERIEFLSKATDSFLYAVSVTGVTGSRGALPADLGAFVSRIEKHTMLPIAVGFGISTPEQVGEVGALSDGVVVGSAIIHAIDKACGVGTDQEGKVDTEKSCQELGDYIKTLKGGLTKKAEALPGALEHGSEIGVGSDAKMASDVMAPGSLFGTFGGRYIPETLVEAHRELELAYDKAQADPAFHEEIAWYRREFIGGPTPLYFAKRLTEHCGGARIWLKREELAHTGAHKINNAVGQALLAKRLGKKRIIAETGAGQHGVASATVCALMGLDLTVYMGAVDCERQKLNVFRMNTLGAKVVPVQSGSRTLKDAINEAMRDWVTNVRDTHYLIGSAIGPHPFPTIVRDFQSVIGKEARAQMLEKNNGKLPDYVVACVGGGSNAIGMFHPFVNDKDVKIVGVEAGGYGTEKGKMNSATLTTGTPGVLHGTRTYLIQDDDGQIPETHSISAGLDYPGVGPEHAFLKDSGRATYVAVTDEQALEGFSLLCTLEGIIPALEPSHALYHVIQMAKELPKDCDILLNLCGRGDKDMPTVAKYMGVDV